MKKKLVLFGIDGADWKIIDPLIAQGCLPNFSKAKNGGSHSQLLSTIPALTAPAWRSIFTGVNPGKHGVYDFFTVENGKLRVTNASDTKVPYFWEGMEERVLAFNIPCAFPIRRIANTTMIAGFGTPSTKARFTDPPDLAGEIVGMEPEYSFRALEADLISLDASSGKDGLADSIIRAARGRARVARHLMESREWDAALIIFSETDWIQHFAIHDFFAKENKSETPIAEVYREMDDFLGYLMEKDYDIVIVSDHGFREIRRFFYVNTYLKEKGFIKIKREKAHKRVLRKAGICLERVVSLVPKAVFRKVNPHALTAKLDKILPASRISVAKVDYEKTSAFLIMQSGGGMHVKEKLDEVILALKEATDEQGKRVFKAILRREDIYLGEHVDKAPQLTLIPEDGIAVREKLPERIFEDIDPEKEKTGVHRPQGVFLSYGKNLRALGQMEDSSVLDIAPTILSYYGYSVPGSMDGRPISVTGSGKKDTLKYDTRMKLSKLRKKVK
jgi:predicted AlkP superfamily phosphohydrolase/phosphomutase